MLVGSRQLTLIYTLVQQQINTGTFPSHTPSLITEQLCHTVMSHLM